MLFWFVWFLCGLLATGVAAFMFLKHEKKITIGELPQGIVVFLLGPISVMFCIMVVIGHFYEKYKDHVIVELVEEESE